MQDKSRSQVDAPNEVCAASDAASVQAHFEETLAQQKEKAEQLKRKRLNLAIIRFVSTWLFFMAILVVFGLLTHLEWARPRIQDSMSETFHRKVKLGELSWVLGLNGLAISTDRLEMLESDGKPFVVAGQSEIGVAFLPLFSKRVLVKHIDFHNPEVFATQLAPGKWNFSDLLVEGPEIRFVQVDKGRLHLRNAISAEQLAMPHAKSMFANTKWSAYDFENVNVKLIFPGKDQKRPWPFYLAFQMPRSEGGRKYTTDFSLTILGQGQFNEWQTKKSNIEVRADNFNPADWRPFIHIPDGVNGLMSVSFKGDGILDKVVSGDIKYSARHVQVVNAGQSLFTAQQLDGAGKASFGPGALKWDKTVLSVGGVKLQTHGEMFDWQGEAPRYDARVSADLRNLAQLSDTSLWHFFPGAKKDKDLAGAAVVEVSFEGEGSDHKVFTSLKAENIPLANLLASTDTGSGAPLLSLFQIEPNAPIKGRIEIGHDQRILLKDVEIPAKGSTLKIQGFIDAQKKQHDVVLQAQNLALDKFDTMELSGKAKADQSKQLALSGKVDFEARLKADAGVDQIDVKAKLNKASLSNQKSVLATDMSGNVKFDGKTIHFESIKGTLANGGVHGGSLVFKGTTQTAKDGTCNLEVSGHQIDIEQLVGFARAARLPLPANAVDDVRGTARDLDIHIEGKVAAPALTVNLSPADIRYAFRPSRSDKSVVKEMRALSGNITLADNMLQLRNVIVAAGQSKLIVNASFESKDKGVVPKLLHLRTSGIDIGEFLQYANSETLPPEIRKNLKTTFAPLHLSDLDGKAYGDLTIRITEKGPHFVEGVVGLTSVSGNFSEQQLPFEHFSGLLSFSGNDVVMQDMSARSGHANFNFSGEVKSFQDAPAWTVQLGGRSRGQDLAPLVPQQLAKSSVELWSLAPLTVRGNFGGDGKTVNGAFIVIAANGDQFRFKSDSGAINQPPGHAMTLDGTLTYNIKDKERSLDLRSWHVTMGESVIQGSAHFAWATDASKKPAVDFILSTPNPVPSTLMLGAFMPGIDAAGATGTMKGTFAAAGEVGDLLTHGELSLNKVSIPSLKVKDVEGKLDSPRWVISSTPNSEKDKLASEARVSLTHGDFGNVVTSDVHATLKLESGPQPRITLKDGNAVVAGGKMSMNGYYLPDVAKWKLELGFEKLQVDQFVSDMIEHSGELSGLADAKITLNSTADGELLHNLAGGGDVVIYKGSVPRLRHLHEKLQTANLLQQGIFGFNLNNVLHSIVPTKTGKFREVSMNFTIDRGIMEIDRLTFDGEDLRLRAAGDWDIAKDQLDLEVAGNIPRVASSILPGAVGEATRNLTLQKAVRVVTFRKLENFPSLPIIGDIGTDDPRAFTFKIAANLDSPDAVTRSIEKSFKWLPNKPNASAHPVPGL